MNRFARRKWGWYLTLLDRKHFKVKLLRFKKGHSISIQYHKNRHELWLFLNGEHSGEVYSILAGEIHCYPAKVATYVLEIQYGERCDEGDIVRL